jgi:poly-gamma-glutamate capsule biosynthesis protein CapA/YwtB (metallophosphatase superfamily)
MRNRQQAMDIRLKTERVHFTRLPSLALVPFILVMLGAFPTLVAQTKETPIITFRQKLLREKHEEVDDVEKIDSFAKLHLMIAGNVYQTEKHAAYAYDKATGKYDYRSELKYIQPILNLGDVTIVNLKTSFTNNNKNMFSSPDEFGLALKYAGVNVALHANVHTANISKANLKRTDEVLDEYDILHTGAFQDNIQRQGNYPLIVNKKGFHIAILNYTNLTSRPTISRDFVINEIDKTAIDRDMRLAHAYKPDFTIVYFDWGSNMQDIPSYAQQELAQYVFQAGANLVVGTHPNTPMRLDLMNYSYNGEQREGIIAYSLGNLVSSNEEMRNRNGYVIDMEILKNNFTTKTHVSDWGVIPVYTYYDTTTVKGKTGVFAVPCANVESADIFPNIAYIEKRRAVNSAYEVRKLLGNTADEIQYNLNELIVNNVEESINITNASLNNKYNPKREDDVKPSDAPELPVATDGSYNPPSLALLYEQPTEVIKPTTLVNKKAEKKTDKGNSYLTHRKLAEAALDNTTVTNNTEIVTDKKNTEPAKTETDLKATKQKEQAVAINTEPVKERAKAIAVETSSVESNTISSNTNGGLSGAVEMTKAKDLELEVDTFYRIQFYALKSPIPLDTNYYTHLKGYEVRVEEGLYKYMLGKYRSFKECENFWKTQIQPRYKQSFIVKFIDGKRIVK